MGDTIWVVDSRWGWSRSADFGRQWNRRGCGRGVYGTRGRMYNTWGGWERGNGRAVTCNGEEQEMCITLGIERQPERRSSSRFDTAKWHAIGNKVFRKVHADCHSCDLRYSWAILLFSISTGNKNKQRSLRIEPQDVM